MITIDWLTKIITVPQSFLTWQGGIAYTLDVNAFRLALKDLEDDETGMPFPDTHNHNTSLTLSGVSYARTLEIINGYSVTFENTGSHYQVTCVGANHNLADVFIAGPVNLVIGNSAGLITVATGGSTGPTAAEIALEVWSYINRTLTSAGAGGATAAEVWGYGARTLTSATPTAAENAAAVRSNLAAELLNIDAPISTRLSSAGYTAPPASVDTAAAVLAALNATTIPVDVKKMNAATVNGTGVPADKWRGNV